MFRSAINIAAVGMAAFVINGCAGQPGSRGDEASGAREAAVPAEAGIERWQPRLGRTRPLVAVIGSGAGAEVTDFVVPYGILATADVADVLAVSTAPGPMELFPALTIRPDATIEEFDRQYPRGADYVIVPAVHDPSDVTLVGWIREQAARGATIVGVCDGTRVLAESGLLHGRRATGHWFSIAGLERRHPEARWVRDRRYVADGNIVTTTGVSASIPVSLALVEAIAGWSRAEEVAASLGIEDWSVEHDSDAYGISTGHLFTWIGNLAAFWRRETVGVEVVNGMDEISLALVADSWARTSRARVETIAPADAPVRTRGGLRLVPDRSTKPDRMITPPRMEPGAALDDALDAIAGTYGEPTASLVALQLEYPWSKTAGTRR